MSDLDKNKVIEALAGALQVIGLVVDQFKSEAPVAAARAKSAADALTAISMILGAVSRGDMAKFSPERAQDDIDRLRASLAANDAATDAAIHEKFPEK